MALHHDHDDDQAQEFLEDMRRSMGLDDDLPGRPTTPQERRQIMNLIERIENAELRIVTPEEITRYAGRSTAHAPCEGLSEYYGQIKYKPDPDPEAPVRQPWRFKVWKWLGDQCYIASEYLRKWDDYCQDRAGQHDVQAD